MTHGEGASPEAEDIYGYGGPELLDVRIQALFGPENRAAIEAEIRRFYKAVSYNAVNRLVHIQISVKPNGHYVDEERYDQLQDLEARQEEIAKRREAYGLNDEEVAVLKLVAMGKKNEEIAEELGITSGSIKHQLIHMAKKLGCGDRTGMVTRYYGDDL